MKYIPQKLTSKETLEIFPEAREIIPEKIKEWQIELRTNAQVLEDCLASIYEQTTDDFSIWFFEEAAKTFLMPPIMEAEKHILRLKRLLSIFSPSGKRLEQWEKKVEAARQYPIYEIASGSLTLRQSGKNFTALCCFHSETNNSFYIYPETNTFHCFGCQENGDVIKLTMHLYGVDFKEAVQMLQN